MVREGEGVRAECKGAVVVNGADKEGGCVKCSIVSAGSGKEVWYVVAIDAVGCRRERKRDVRVDRE